MLLKVQINRRELLQTAGAVMAKGASDFSRCRADFPWSENQIFLNNAGWHPMGVHSVNAIHRYLDYKLKGPGPGRDEVGGDKQEAVRAMFARLIGAQPREIAFVQSTLMGENLVVQGLGIPGSRYNVVTDELHYEGSMFLYKTLQQEGLDVRIAKRRNWRVEARDYEPLVDRNTRLLACSLVSYLNGYLHDAKAISALAHTHNAYVYADIVQAAGAVPIDVKAGGIDFAACSGYKWLMGDRGLGYLYVRDELQGKVMRSLQHGDRQFTDFEYHILPYDSPGPYPASWKRRTDAGGQYEVGNISNSAVAAQHEALRYILDLGVENIRAHARPMTEKLQRELPRLGYEPMTPPGNQTPIVSFVVKDPAATARKLKQAGVVAKVQWHHMRVSPSVYNTMADVDRLLNALG